MCIIKKKFFSVSNSFKLILGTPFGACRKPIHAAKIRISPELSKTGLSFLG